jgi:hypothetical protein
LAQFGIGRAEDDQLKRTAIVAAGDRPDMTVADDSRTEQPGGAGGDTGRGPAGAKRSRGVERIA